MKKNLWILAAIFFMESAIARTPSSEELALESKKNSFAEEPRLEESMDVDDISEDLFQRENEADDEEYYLLNEDGTLTPIDVEEAYAHATEQTGKVLKKKKGRNCEIKQGKASWYGPGFAGNLTANGERFNPNDFTAAHKTLRFNSIVRVTYRGRSVDVRINDDGPHIKGRVIDLSKAAAQKIGLIAAGHAKVTLELIECG